MKVKSLKILFFCAVLETCVIIGDADLKTKMKSLLDNHEEIDNLNSEEFKSLLKFSKKVQRLTSLANRGEEIISFLKSNEELGIENLTLIGSQNVYTPDGVLKQVRTIELFVPQEPKNDTSEKDDSDDDEDILETHEWIRLLSSMGIDMNLFAHETDEDDHIKQLYIDNDVLATFEDGFHMVNKTIVVDTFDDIAQDYNRSTVGQSVMVSSYLVFDKKGKLIRSRSTIEPELFGLVKSETDQPSAKIIQSALKSLVYRTLESDSQEEVLEGMRKDLEKQYPGITFIVVQGTLGGLYISDYFNIELSYEFIESDDDLTYTVYGLKTKGK